MSASRYHRPGNSSRASHWIGCGLPAFGRGDTLTRNIETRLAQLEKDLQASEKARAEYGFQTEGEISFINVLIHAAGTRERDTFWQKVQEESRHISARHRESYNILAHALLNQYLAFSTRFRLLYVILPTSLDKADIQQTRYRIFDTDSLIGFSRQPDGSVLAPPPLSTLRTEPWYDPQTAQPSPRYNHLIPSVTSQINRQVIAVAA